MQLDVGIAQNLGQREEQQDAFGYNLGDERIGSLFIVADGMGGMKHGSVASKFAVDFMTEVFSRQKEIDNTPEFLNKLMYGLNEKIVGFSRQKKMAGEVGTTVVAVLINEDKLYWVSVGDSRIYLFKNNYLLQLSYDHVYENQLKEKVEKRELLLSDALRKKEKNYLTSYIGMGVLKEVDYNAKPLVLENGDKIVLCSDGIYNVLSELEFNQYLINEPQVATDEMVAGIIQKNYKNQDNMTVMVLEYQGDD